MNLLFLLIIVSLNYTNSHTWIDRVECSCPEMNVGYPRSYIGRACLPDKFDIYNTYQVPGRNDNSPICSQHQSVQYQFENFPALKCTPGSKVTVYYNPNGHVSKDPCINGDPRPCRGNISPMTNVYILSNKNIFPEELKTRGQVNKNYNLATGTPEYDSKLFHVLAKATYDGNGTCKEDSDPCHITFTLPMDLEIHTNYQFIFYHTFDRDPFSATGEEYTTCMTIHAHPFPECMS